MPEDPLGALERELIAAARRRSRSAVPSRGEAFGGVLALALGAFAVILVLAAVLFVAGH